MPFPDSATAHIHAVCKQPKLGLDLSSSPFISAFVVPDHNGLARRESSQWSCIARLCLICLLVDNVFPQIRFEEIEARLETSPQEQFSGCFSGRAVTGVPVHQ